MSIPLPELDSDEREAAQALWQALMFASNKLCLEQARQQLRETPDPVHRAVVNVIVWVWKQDRHPYPDENPFLGHLNV